VAWQSGGDIHADLTGGIGGDLVPRQLADTAARTQDWTSARPLCPIVCSEPSCSMIDVGLERAVTLDER